MSKSFHSERDGQIEFFDDLKISTDVELTNNTDGVYKGTLFEFKLSISDINKVLFQAIKYLSHMRIKGEPIPAQILLVGLNQEVAYLFNSGDYLDDIEKVYAGAASKNNQGFSARTEPEKIDFSKITGLARLTEVLEVNKYTKVHIDVFDVAGWAERFYTENPAASKIKLFDELRKPDYFKNYILPPDKASEYSWNGDEADFKYIMDLLNDKQHKKELGAFYTPAPYCLKATELVRRAIAQIPKSHDYIILDRTAGTGNLEEFLTDKNVDDIALGELEVYVGKSFKKDYIASVADGIDLVLAKTSLAINEITLGDLTNYETTIKIREHIFDNELAHTIVNTYELKEWIVLNERLGNKVKLVIPPEADPTNALVNGGDALSDHFVLGSNVGRMFISDEYKAIIDELNDYVANEKTNIILYENPPFRDESSNSHMRGGASNSFIKSEMKKIIRGSAVNDLSNQFIWSGWQYYLRKPNDFFVLFSPIKYWKSNHLSDRRFVEGYIFNRLHFHVNTPSAIACILWQNQQETREALPLSVWDIEQDRDGKKVAVDCKKTMNVKRVYSHLSKFYDKRIVASDKTDGVACSLNGKEYNQESVRVTKRFNKNILGYLVTQQFGFENPRLATNLTRCAIYNGNGFFLRDDNFIEKLPLFAAGKMPIEKTWWLNGTIFKTFDGGDAFTNDEEFLKSCFIFTGLSYYNKCRSFDGSDDRFYKNELCFDADTLASSKLEEFKLTSEEHELLAAFAKVLREAKTTENYNPKFAYGTYQIDQELNTRYKDENDAWRYDHPELNGDINSLKTKLASYYETVVQPKLFQYELLK